MAQHQGNPHRVSRLTQQQPGSTAAAWGPLSQPLFRALWLATVVSHIGMEVQKWARRRHQRPCQNPGASIISADLCPEAARDGFVLQRWTVSVMLLSLG